MANIDSFWTDDSPFAADICVIDDPQCECACFLLAPASVRVALIVAFAALSEFFFMVLFLLLVTACIPHIRRMNPKAKIIFRSHIQSGSSNTSTERMASFRKLH